MKTSEQRNVSISLRFAFKFYWKSSTYPFGVIEAFKLVGLVGFENEPRSSLAKSLNIVNRETDLLVLSTSPAATSLADFLVKDLEDFVRAKIGDDVENNREGL